MINRRDISAGLFTTIFGILVYWQAVQLPTHTATDNLGGGRLPKLLAILLIAFGILLMITGRFGLLQAQGFKERMRGRQPGQSRQGGDASDDGELTRVLLVGGLMVVYAWLIHVVGYVVMSVIIFSAMIVVLGERRWPRVAMVVTIITASLYLLFSLIFHIPVPEGILF